VREYESAASAALPATPDGWNTILPVIAALPGLWSCTDVRKNVPFAPGVEPTTGRILRSVETLAERYS
jgi:hypothetical protein